MQIELTLEKPFLRLIVKDYPNLWPEPHWKTIMVACICKEGAFLCPH